MHRNNIFCISSYTKGFINLLVNDNDGSRVTDAGDDARGESYPKVNGGFVNAYEYEELKQLYGEDNPTLLGKTSRDPFFTGDRSFTDICNYYWNSNIEKVY